MLLIDRNRTIALWNLGTSRQRYTYILKKQQANVIYNDFK